MTDRESGGALRAAAARAVYGVVADGASLERALERAGAGIAARDLPRLQALAFGTVRWHVRHRCHIVRLLNRPLRPRDRILEALLSVGLFELTHGREPEYAAVSAAVAGARKLGLHRATGLVNAALRRFQRERAALLEDCMARPECRHAHPAWLIEALRADWPEHWGGVLDTFQTQPPLWVRVNLHRTTRGECAARLAEGGFATEAPADFPAALRLDRPAPVEEIPGFSEGLISVQDAGAQLAAPWLDARPGMRVLDACAAPGGKTVHMLEHAGGDLDVLALDLDPARLARVESNLSRTGYRAQVCAGDAGKPKDWWDGEGFDRILVDAPCSALGVVRRHPDIRFLRRPEDIAELAARQRSLLASLWPMLRPGGRLLYSTCSILHAENADVVAGFAAATADAVMLAPPVSPPAAAMAIDGGWQLLPGAADTDGFYYALMTRGH